MLLTLCGCAAPKPAPATPAPPRKPGFAVTPATERGVRLSDYRCEASGAETCDARDNDCDNVVDEGCGYGTGAVQVTLAWDSGADLDLYITDPSGQTLFYNENNRTSPSGGQLDHDARGDCRPDQPHPRIENAFWPDAVPGTYRVEIANFGPCGAEGTTPTTVSVSIRGQVAGVFEYTLEPEQRVQVVEFSLE